MSQNASAHDFDVVVIGAGIAGICALYRLRELGLRVRALEEADGVGGTWYWNGYPGCRFDIQSREYSYSFSKELLEEWDWSELYSGQPENERYCNFVVDKLDLRRDIQLGVRVTSLIWDEERRHWTVGLADQTSTTARFVIAAIGDFSREYVPSYPGFQEYRGIWAHTSRWPREGIELEGKRVGVIGTGSTGVQVVQEVAKIASRLVVFQRTATYCLPLRNRPIGPEEMRRIKDGYPELFEFCLEHNTLSIPSNPKSAYDYTKEERLAYYEQIWENDPVLNILGIFDEAWEPGKINDELSEWFKGKIREQVHDPAIAEKLVPTDHGVGAKRIPAEEGYYAAFNRDNVQLVDVKADPIEGFTASGIKTQDHDFELDVVIFATGFDIVTGPLSTIEIRGERGRTLQEHFAEGFRSYLHLMFAGFPNLYLPSPNVTGNYVRGLEPLIDWIGEMICHVRRSGATQIVPTREAEEAWFRHGLEKVMENPTSKKSKYAGANIPGKPLVPTNVIFMSEGEMRAHRAEIAAGGYRDFAMS
jgi:cation diffusion facilitator CzcD-associated flavoprotein CzcO